MGTSHSDYRKEVTKEVVTLPPGGMSSSIGLTRNTAYYYTMNEDTMLTFVIFNQIDKTRIIDLQLYVLEPPITTLSTNCVNC